VTACSNQQMLLIARHVLYILRGKETLISQFSNRNAVLVEEANLQSFRQNMRKVNNISIFWL